MQRTKDGIVFYFYFLWIEELGACIKDLHINLSGFVISILYLSFKMRFVYSYIVHGTAINNQPHPARNENDITISIQNK